MATLIYNDLDDLRPNGSNRGEVFFWSEPFYVDTSRIPFFPTLVKRGEEMRLDRVCQRLHGDIQYTQNLCLINGIINPFSIKERQILVYTRPELYSKIEDFDRTNQAITDQLRRRLGNDSVGSGRPIDMQNGNSSSRGIRLEDGVIRMG